MIWLRIAAFLLSLASTDAVRATAPAYLTSTQAREHLAAAEIAGLRYGVSPAVLLSVAWHESRYQNDVRTPLGARTSCGVMTPEPLTRCASHDLLDGYLAGAAHLRTWLDSTRTFRDALTGYAGGYRLLALCAGESPPSACATADVFLARSRWITSVLRAR